VVRWRRARLALWSSQVMEVSQIATIASTSEYRVREVIHKPQSRRFRLVDSEILGGTTSQVHASFDVAVHLVFIQLGPARELLERFRVHGVVPVAVELIAGERHRG
jgi:hypothetical protein